MEFIIDPLRGTNLVITPTGHCGHHWCMASFSCGGSFTCGIHDDFSSDCGAHAEL